MRTIMFGLVLVALFPTAAAASPLEAGRFERLSGDSGVLVAAPHGGYDRHSEDVAREVALMAGAGYLLAIGYRTFDHPWNVNRPTMGVRLKPDAEARPPEAAVVYGAYAARVRERAPVLYVEIHGNSRKESARWIEVATQGLSAEEARSFRAFFQARVAQLTDVPRFGMGIEPLDPIHYRASGAKRGGIFREVGRVLHLELPWAMRKDQRVRSRYAWAIASALLDFQKAYATAPASQAD